MISAGFRDPLRMPNFCCAGSSSESLCRALAFTHGTTIDRSTSHGCIRRSPHHIRDLIRFRYRLIPYLYDLLWRSHRAYTPIIRPTFYEFPEDECCYAENDDMLLGENLLVAPVVEPQKRARSVYLPAGSGWDRFWSGDYYRGGQEILLACAMGSSAAPGREGCAIPLNIAEQHFLKRSDQRGFCSTSLTVMTGNSNIYVLRMTVRAKAIGRDIIGLGGYITTSGSELLVKIERQGEGYPKSGQVSLLFRRQETRRIEVRGGWVVAAASGPLHRQLTLAFANPES